MYCLIGPAAALKKRHGVVYAGTYGKTRDLKTAGIRQTDAECLANARLIAAAPELLTWAKRALSYIEDDHEGNDEESGSLFDMKAMRAAIAKAEGRS